ncbi:hypothetical protein Ciccas_010979 [Cichlidogyrus casuarinus]|uniref:Uncharacterized protein n=1 Tax=Cichlidogyrus casuarinus TaxID=1844966 RepID=A0ABD2PSK8_9PLAT
MIVGACVRGKKKHVYKPRKEEKSKGRDPERELKNDLTVQPYVTTSTDAHRLLMEDKFESEDDHEIDSYRGESTNFYDESAPFLNEYSSPHDKDAPMLSPLFPLPGHPHPPVIRANGSLRNSVASFRANYYSPKRVESVSNSSHSPNSQPNIFFPISSINGVGIASEHGLNGYESHGFDDPKKSFVPMMQPMGLSTDV